MILRAIFVSLTSTNPYIMYVSKAKDIVLGLEPLRSLPSLGRFVSLMLDLSQIRSHILLEKKKVRKIDLVIFKSPLRKWSKYSQK